MVHSPAFQGLIRLFKKAYQENLSTRYPIHWTRRRFLRRMILATGSAVTTTALGNLRHAHSQTKTPRIAIIGGGIAGLNAAYQLKKQGYLATVYEARNRLGGRIDTRTNIFDKGLYLDFGGVFVNSDHQDILDLVDELNLSLFNFLEVTKTLPMPASAYYFEKQYRTEAELAKQLRPLAQQIAKDATLMEEDFLQWGVFFDRLSVADYLQQHANKIPTPWLRVLIENAIRSEYGVESSEASSLQLIFLLPKVEGDTVEILGSSDEAYMIKGGSSQIINGLVNRLPQQIKTRKILTKVAENNQRFYLTFSDKEVVEVDYVILAIPITLLKTIEFKVQLPRKFKQFISEVDLGNNRKIFARFNKKLWQENKCFSKEIWTDLGYSMAWESILQIPNRVDGVLTFFHGGKDANKTLQSPTHYKSELIDSLDLAIPQIKSAVSGQFIQTNWIEDRFTKGSYTNFKPGQLSEFAEFFYIESELPNERQTVAVGNLIFAGEQFSDDFYGYMNGGAQTGRLAAEVVAQNLKINR